MGTIGKSALGVGALAMTIGGALPAIAASTSHDTAKAGSYEQASNYRRGWNNRHRDRVDAGDILTGIGILAGIAIIADAASKSNRNRNDAPPPPPERYPDDYSYDAAAPRAGNDIGSAVEACSAAAERSAGGDARVEEIRSATRDGSGWRVEGSLSGNGSDGFICGANGGVVDFIQLQN